MQGRKEKLKEYMPFGLVFGKNAYDNNGNRNVFYYDRSWLCRETGNIHHNEKSVLNCVTCSEIYE